MLIDLQMTTASLLAGIRNQMRAYPICPPKERNAGAETFLVDHVEVTDRTELARVPAPVMIIGHDGPPFSMTGIGIKVRQEILLHVVTFTGLQQSGAAPAPALQKVAVRLEFLLTLELVNLRPQLHVAYLPPANIGEVGAVVPDAAQQIDAALADFSGSVPLKLGGVEALLGREPLFTNAGMTLNDDATVVTVRFENGTDPDTPAAWAAFFANPPPDLMRGRQWGLLVDKRLLLPVALEFMNGAKKSLQGQFDPSGPPEALWAENGHGIHVTQSGVAPDAGPLDTDVDVTVTVGLDFSLPSADRLVFSLFISSSGEVGGLVGAVLGFLGLGADPAASQPAPPGWAKVGENAYVQTRYLNLGNRFLGRLVAETLEPDERGLHLTGSAKPPSAVRPAAVQADVAAFEWGVHGSCSDGPRVSCLGFLGLHNTGTAPLKVCEARVLVDPDDQFPLTIVLSDEPSAAYDAEVRVELARLRPEYLTREEPYPCLLLVRTNGGARLVSLGKPSQLPDGVARRLDFDRIAQIGNCKLLVDNFWGSRLNPKWIPDPGPDENALHLWEVLVRGLDVGEAVTMLDADGRVTAAVEAGSDGIARAVSAVVPAREREMTLLRSGRAAPARLGREATALEGRSIEIRQAFLAPVAVIPGGGRPMRLLAGFHGSVPVLVIASGAEVRFYDLRLPEQPTLLQDVGIGDLGMLTEMPSGVPVGTGFARIRPEDGAVAIYTRKAARPIKG